MKNNLYRKGFIVPILLGILALLAIGGGVYFYNTKKVSAPVVNEKIDISIVNQKIEDSIFDKKVNVSNEKKEIVIPKDKIKDTTAEVKKNIDDEAKIVTIKQRDPKREAFFNDIRSGNLNISTINLKKYENDKYSFFTPNESFIRFPDSTKASNPLVGCNIIAVNVDHSDPVIGIVFIYQKICQQLIFEYVGDIDAYGEKDGYIIAGVFVGEPDKNPDGLLKFKELYRDIRNTFSINKEMKTIDVYLGNYFYTDRKCTDSNIIPVTHYISKDIDEARASVEELLKEPSLTEKTAYYWSSFNKSFSLKSFDLKDGVATVDLSTSLDPKSTVWVLEFVERGWHTHKFIIHCTNFHI